MDQQKESTLGGIIQSLKKMQPAVAAIETEKRAGNNGGAGCLVSLTVLLAIGFLLYSYYAPDSWLDQSGWVSHTEDGVITAQSSWLAGESKECASVPLIDPKSEGFPDKDFGYALSAIHCDDGPEHHIKIQFFGRQDQPEHRGIVWNCKKNSDSVMDPAGFVCKETGASPY